MFKRSIEMKIVKSPKNSTSTETSEETPSIDYVQLVRNTTETVAASVIVGVVLYVGADTLRQVIVKLTPQH